MTITTLETRKSWIWFDAYGAPLAGGAAEDALAARLVREDTYARLLVQAALEPEAVGASSLSLPWPPGSGALNSFWRLYLEEKPLEDLPFDATGCEDEAAKGEARKAWERKRRLEVEKWAPVAWRHFVPLRLAIPLRGDGGENEPPRVEVGELPAQHLALEAFLYPHGVGLVATVHLRGERTLKETASGMRDCWDRIAFSLFDGTRSLGRFKLSLLAPPLLDRLRHWAGGPEEAERRSGPFSVATVVNGSVGPEALEVEQDGPVHRALQGLCSGHADWQHTPAPALAEHTLTPRPGAPSHLLLACGDGRLVWSPTAFNALPSRQTRLGCYHRNLTLLSLQVESLLGLVALGHHDLSADGEVRSGELEDLVRLAANELGRLYGRTSQTPTYRSASAPAQIDHGGRKAVVDAVRRGLGIGEPLFR